MKKTAEVIEYVDFKRSMVAWQRKNPLQANAAKERSSDSL